MPTSTDVCGECEPKCDVCVNMAASVCCSCCDAYCVYICTYICELCEIWDQITGEVLPNFHFLN